MMRSKIIKIIYWTTVIVIIGLILNSCYFDQDKVLIQSYQKVLPAVVFIRGDRIDDRTNEIRGIGTGFFVSHNYILTNAHVIKKLKSGTIELRLWNGNIIPTKKIAVDSFNDLALLQIDPNDIKSYKLPILDFWLNPQVGETVFVVGSPNAFDGTLTKGIFSRGTTRTNHFQWIWLCKVYLIDANIERGNSGSPVFNMNCKIVGIVSGHYRDFAVVIPSYSIRAFLKEHKIGY